MDSRWLEDVLILLEEGNMTRAAERRNITQPAFSRRIRNFESWLGQPVMERGANRVDISAALASNETEIRALLARLRDLRGKIANFDADISTITIAAQHAPVFSTFPDMALRAKTLLPGVRFRLRPGNLRDCVTVFLRRDATILLVYEAEHMVPLPFSDGVTRSVWGWDQLIPVIGGGLRFLVGGDGEIPWDTPAIVYPEESYFGETLLKAEKPFGTNAFTRKPICETAFSTGIKELVSTGLGVAWLPIRMCHRELERGDLVSLAPRLGAIPLDVVLYSDSRHEPTRCLVDVWSGRVSAESRQGASL